MWYLSDQNNCKKVDKIFAKSSAKRFSKICLKLFQHFFIVKKSVFTKWRKPTWWSKSYLCLFHSQDSLSVVLCSKGTKSDYAVNSMMQWKLPIICDRISTSVLATYGDPKRELFRLRTESWPACWETLVNMTVANNDSCNARCHSSIAFFFHVFCIDLKSYLWLNVTGVCYDRVIQTVGKRQLETDSWKLNVGNSKM